MWIEADKNHCWHPFTRHDEWECSEPLVLVRGEGVWLWDCDGNRYLDGNASIWTNIHGHGHPELNEAITKQIGEVAHTSYLGFANPRASELAARLCAMFPDGTLERVFFSDDGSTAVECALKMALQYRMQTGEPERTGLLAFNRAYHGDTMGAAALGGVAEFFERFKKLGLPVTHLANLESLDKLPAETIRQTAAVVIEPLVQGVNEIHVWPSGMLAKLRVWCDRHGIHLILDEVMTGFGRTGSMFACQQENVVPDFLCLAKGLTGGYMPMAATLTTEKVFDAFRGGAKNAFYYGHSYTANPLGCAVALASLDVFKKEQTLSHLPRKIELLSHLLRELCETFPCAFDFRQCGMVSGIELRKTDGEKFPAGDRIGETFCHILRAHGVLTRPILDTIVIMPPLSISEEEIAYLGRALKSAMVEFLSALGDTPSC